MNVFLIIFCFCVVSSDAANDTEESESNTEIKPVLCVLPPYPKHGKYTNRASAPPGKSVALFELDVTCDKGYNLIGESKVVCVYGSMLNEMPVCLPYCEVDHESTVRCEETVLRCLLTSSDRSTPARLIFKPERSDTDCGTTGLLRRRREPISGGYNPKKNEFPWHTGIYRKEPALNRQICGGTLIAKRVVISAAHCFTQNRQKPLASNYAVAAGKIHHAWNEEADIYAQKSDVLEIKLPPRYQGVAANYQDDIAVVISLVEFYYTGYVKPACLSFDLKFDEEQFTEGNLGKIAGWGLVNEEAYQSTTLLAANLPYINIEKCMDESPASFRSFITSDKFCAGYSNGTSACRGDSGGGYVMAAKLEFEDRYFLRGVISTSPTSDKACNIYTWITFTHVMRHAEFIKSALGVK